MQKTTLNIIYFWVLISFSILAMPVDTLSTDAKITLLTVDAGSELYSTFGHSAIRIIDPKQNLDRIYNYGTFNFDDPDFYLNFVRGQLDYMLYAYPFKYARHQYKTDKRTTVQQVLNLSLKMKNQIYWFLEWNFLPENRFYRYDFFFDNCATRIRNVFEDQLKTNLKLSYDPTRKMTFRNYIDSCLTTMPVSDFGIDLALGLGTDRIATAREALFLPDYLYLSFVEAQINIGGEWQPFILQTDTLLHFNKEKSLLKTFPWVDAFFWSLLVFVSILTYRSKNIKLPKRFIWDGIFFIILGLLSLLILFLWFATDHKVTPDNWNIVWVWLPHLIIGFFLIRGNFMNWISKYLAIYSIICVAIVIGWFAIPQQLHTAVIPILLMLTIRSFWISQLLKIRHES